MYFREPSNLIHIRMNVYIDTFYIIPCNKFGEKKQTTKSTSEIVNDFGVWLNDFLKYVNQNPPARCENGPIKKILDNM